MGEELSESDLQRVKDLEPQTPKQQDSTENVEPPDSAESNDDGLDQAAIKDEASSSVPSNESPVSEDLESTNSSSAEEPDLKKSPIVKWDSPASTTEPEIGSNSPLDSGQETSPDNQEIRPTTVSSRSQKMNRLRDIGKKFFEDAPNKIREMFNSVLPRKEFSTDSQSGTSSFYGEGSSGDAHTLQPPLQIRTPLQVEFTSQAGVSGTATANSGNSLSRPTAAQNGSALFFNKEGNLLSIQGSRVSNGKASAGEISNMKDDLSSPTKKAKLQIDREVQDDSSDNDSLMDEVHISPEMENNQISESETEDADMS